MNNHEIKFKDFLADARRFKSKSQWKRNSYRLFNIAQKNGFLDKIFNIAKYTSRIPFSYWTFELCKKESLKYKSRTEWARKSHGSYRAASANGWIDNLTNHMKSSVQLSSENRTKWTVEKCKKIALKYKTKAEWQRKHSWSYNSAIRKGIVSECSKHMTSFIKWDTKEACMKDAKRFKRRRHWNRESGGAYQSAIKNGWLDECCAHMEVSKVYTLEDCKKEALKYKTKTEWLNKDPSTYWSAYSRGFYKECTKHMKDQANCELREKKCAKVFFKKLKKQFPESNIIQEYLLNRYNIPDIYFELDNQIYLLEIKHDDSFWKKIEIKNQILKYQTEGVKKFKSKFKKVILCSPRGKYGLSFNEVLNLLSKI